MLDLPELGHFPPTPQYPTDPASTQFPPKHQRQEIWIQVPALPQTPWPWPTPAPSTSVFICMMLCGVVTRPLLPLPWLTASTWPPGLPSILSSRPLAGPLGRTGEHGGGQRILCFGPPSPRAPGEPRPHARFQESLWDLAPAAR